MSIRESLQTVSDNIEKALLKSGRSREDVKLIAVSKTRSAEDVNKAIDAGQKEFGENTIQDALSKIPTINSDAIEWHFIGHLQSKKAKSIPGNFTWVHTVDSIKLAQRLSSAMQDYDQNSQLNCLIQVNVSEEETKTGIMLNELDAFCSELLQLHLPCIQWRGLMTIGVQDASEATRSVFKSLNSSLVKYANQFSSYEFNQLSMGMSADYEIAIEEGATLLRIGTSIFGKRF